MKISFIVAAYNIESYVRACIDSILFCASPNDEIIVVDDGSTDATNSIVNEIADQHENVTVYKKDNGGLSSARNAGLGQASGDYILFLDGDDVLITETFPAIKGYLEKDQPDILITDHLNWLNDGLGPTIPSQPRTHHPYATCKNPNENLSVTLHDCIPCVWTRFFHRNLFDKLPSNPFNESLIYDDLPLTPHITALANSLLYIPIPLVKYRSRPNSITKSRSYRSCTDMVAAAAIAAKAIKRLSFDPNLAVTADIMLARKAMEAIRQCREVQNPSYKLYDEIILTANNNFTKSTKTTIRSLKSSTSKTDHRIAKHLQIASNIRVAYIISKRIKTNIFSAKLK